MAGFYISRQRYYPSNQLAIEIAVGGPKFSGPDKLDVKYAGEGKNLKDPRDAVNVAIRIYSQWMTDRNLNERVILNILEDRAGKFNLDKKGMNDAKIWAEGFYKRMDKCSNCQSLLTGKKEKFVKADGLKGEYCSQNCCATKYFQIYGTNLKFDKKEDPDD
jgi:hypothetical protein